jgi:hypothetical protein
VHRVLAPLLIACAFAGLACRQIAGIEEIKLPADAGNGDGAVSCDCPGCTVLDHDLDLPLSLVLVGDGVYVLVYGSGPGKGSLVRVPTAGGQAQVVVGALTQPISLVADATNLYWMAVDTAGSGILERVAIAGGAPVTLATGLAVPDFFTSGVVQGPTNTLIALTATDVYFVNFIGGDPAGVRSVPVGGGDAGTLLADSLPDAGVLSTSEVYSIATNGQSLFAIEDNCLFSGIVSMPLSGGPLKVLTGDLTNPYDFTLSGQSIIFSDIGNGVNGSVQSVPLSGGAPKFLAQDLPVPWALLVDQGFVYCTNFGSGPVPGSIVKIAQDGGKPEALAEAPQPEDLVTDSEYVYWVDSVCGTLTKVAK